MSLNIYGLIISIVIFIPNILLLFLPPKVRVKHIRHKQIEIINRISSLGINAFGLLTINNIGYKPYNIVFESIWIILMVILVILYYLCYFRYIFKGRKEEYLYNKVLIYCPISILTSLIYLLSGILLFNPYVIIFSLMYTPANIYIHYKKNFE
ncbi:MAG: hypothetical protein IJA65_04345 [Acholeplasmatales bacterium]|nr:hypothetical protein [Acholeplasmatales bacterium]